ncbi:hypothetical protein FDUTEX481_08159 [Tolypothrix sp. PCC 7601]|nr:hypothetical protein FDUTEX481_08159 [Tolypothrix sp. PCC 7601]
MRQNNRLQDFQLKIYYLCLVKKLTQHSPLTTHHFSRKVDSPHSLRAVILLETAA